MSTRQKHSELLLEAAACLDPIDINSFAPQLCLRPALEQAMAVWTESESYIDPRLRTRLRIAILNVRNLLKATDSGALIEPSDANLITASIETFRALAPALLKDPRARAPDQRIVNTSLSNDNKQSHVASDALVQHSVRGLRLHSFQDLAGPQMYELLDANMHQATAPATRLVPIEMPLVAAEDSAAQLLRFEAMRGKLKSTLKPGESYVLVEDIPLIIYTSGIISDRALDRAGLSYIRIRDSGAGGRDGPHKVDKRQDCILLEHQLVLGIKSELLQKFSADEVVSKLATRISQRFGPHTNPLVNAARKTFRSPGNPFEWMWLLPNHIINTRAISGITSVSFPWQSKPTAVTNVIDESKNARLAKELKSLQEQQVHLEKRGMELDKSSIDRMSELQVMLDATPTEKPLTPSEKMAKMKETREHLEAQIKAKFASEMAKAHEISLTLIDLGKPKPGENALIAQQRKTLTKQLRELNAQIEKGRNELMAAMRGAKSLGL